jgi:hypothetical protein
MMMCAGLFSLAFIHVRVLLIRFHFYIFYTIYNSEVGFIELFMLIFSFETTYINI